MADPIEYDYVNENMDEDLKCCMCLEPFIDPVLGPCDHTYCRACIVKSFSTNGSANCPLCQQTVSESDLTKVRGSVPRMLGKLVVRCSRKGCVWTGPRSNLKDPLRAIVFKNSMRMELKRVRRDWATRRAEEPSRRLRARFGEM